MLSRGLVHSDDRLKQMEREPKESVLFARVADDHHGDDQSDLHFFTLSSYEIVFLNSRTENKLRINLLRASI